MAADHILPPLDNDQKLILGQGYNNSACPMNLVAKAIPAIVKNCPFVYCHDQAPLSVTQCEF